MANVQLENGYIKIANDLFEQFFTRDFSAKQLRILLLVIRFSYGFNKKTALISPQNRFEMAFLYQCDIKKELNYLESNGVILCDYSKKIFAVNKNFDEWKIAHHNLFNKEKFAHLKIKNLCVEQRNALAYDKENPLCITKENVSNTQSTLCNTKKTLCDSQSKTFVIHKVSQAENIDSETNTPPSKYINTIKTCINTNIVEDVVEETPPPTTSLFKKDIPEISDEDILLLKEESKNFYGEYRNVYLEQKNYKKLLALSMNEKAVDRIIADFSRKIELGKEPRYSKDLPNQHFLKLIGYWEFLRKHPEMLIETNKIETKESRQKSLAEFADELNNEGY